MELKVMVVDAKTVVRIVSEYRLDTDVVYRFREVMTDALRNAQPSMAELENLVVESGGSVNRFRQYLNDWLSEVDPESDDEDGYWWAISMALLIA